MYEYIGRGLLEAYPKINSLSATSILYMISIRVQIIYIHMFLNYFDRSVVQYLHEIVIR